MDSIKLKSGNVQPITADDFRQAIGSLVILWSQIETEFRIATEALGGTPQGVFGSKIVDLWKTLNATHASCPAQIAMAERFLFRIEIARCLRNGICHGFQGYSADPFGRGQTAELYYRSENGTVTVSYRQTQRTIADLARSGFILHRLTHATRNPDIPGKAAMIAEVGLDLDRIAQEHPGTV